MNKRKYSKSWVVTDKVLKSAKRRRAHTQTHLQLACSVHWI